MRHTSLHTLFTIIATILLLSPTFALPASDGRLAVQGELEERQCKDKPSGDWKANKAYVQNGRHGHHHGGLASNNPTGNTQPVVVSSAPNGGPSEGGVVTRTSTRTATVTESDDHPSTTVIKDQPTSSAAPQPTTSSSSGGGIHVDDSNTKGKISTRDPKELLKLHNDYRADHKALAMTWDDSLQEYATKWGLGCTHTHR